MPTEWQFPPPDDFWQNEPTEQHVMDWNIHNDHAQNDTGQTEDELEIFYITERAHIPDPPKDEPTLADYLSDILNTLEEIANHLASIDDKLNK